MSREFRPAIRWLGYLAIGAVLSLAILLICSFTVKVALDGIVDSVTEKVEPQNPNETP